MTTPRRAGEIVIVVAPRAEAAAPDAGEIDEMLRRALERVSVKDAVSEVAAVTGRPRREIYQRALELSNGDDDGPREVSRQNLQRQARSASPRSMSGCRLKAAPRLS